MPVDDKTTRQVVDHLIDLGLVTPEQVAERLTSQELSAPLAHFAVGSSADAALLLLEELGLAYTAEYDTLHNACRHGAELYEQELTHIAGTTRGVLTITDVTRTDEAGHHVLRFRCNGSPREWRIRHTTDRESHEAQLKFCLSIDQLLATGSPARWCRPIPSPGGFHCFAVFADPLRLNRFGAHYGLTFTTLA